MGHTQMILAKKIKILHFRCHLPACITRIYWALLSSVSIWNCHCCNVTVTYLLSNLGGRHYKIEYPISEVDDHERPSASWVAWWCLAEHFRLSRPQVKATAVCGLPVMAPAGQGDQQDRIWGDTGGWQRFLHMAQTGRCEGITGRIATTDLGMRRGFRQAVLPHYDKT